MLIIHSMEEEKKIDKLITENESNIAEIKDRQEQIIK